MIKRKISNPRVRKKALYRTSDDNLDSMTTGEIIRKYGHLFSDDELYDMIVEGYEDKDDFVFRYNGKALMEYDRFEISLSKFKKGRLKYKMLINLV